MPELKVVVFVKAPILGKVKTRLAKSIGDKAALEAYKELTLTVLGRIKNLTKVDLCFTPDDSINEVIPWAQENWTTTPQGLGNLGERMCKVFDNTTEPTLLIGSDCPYLKEKDLIEAGHALEKNDLVLGPAKDGGYWMIGMKTPTPSLFKEINWGSSTVYKSTVLCAKEQGLRIWEGRMLGDIDYADDWFQFKAKQSP